MQSAIYGILDLVAGALIGQVPLHVFRHEAVAIRFFTEVAGLENGQVNRHLADHNLVRLGYLFEDTELVPDFATVLTGATLLASQQPRLEKNA